MQKRFYLGQPVVLRMHQTMDQQLLSELRSRKWGLWSPGAFSTAFRVNRRN